MYKRQVLTRALGTSLEVEIDIIDVDVDEGDVLLFCTDGLTSLIEEEEIREVVLMYLSLIHIYTETLTAREAALKTLVKTEAQESYINLTLPSFLQRLPAHEKPLATAIAYGTDVYKRQVCISLISGRRRGLSS